MNGVALRFDAGMAILLRDARIFFSYRTRLISQIVAGIVSVCLFFYISRMIEVSAVGDADDYFGFVVVGIVIMRIVQSTMGVASTVYGEMVAGTFERVVVSPFGPVASIASMGVFPFFRALLIAAVSLVFAASVFGLQLRTETMALAVPIAALSSVAFIAFGLLFAALMFVAKQAMAATGWVTSALVLVSGFYFPTTLLPDWIEWTSEVQPFTPTVDLLRNVLVGTELADPAGLYVAKLCGFALVMVPIALIALRAAVGYSRSRGTVIEV